MAVEMLSIVSFLQLKFYQINNNICSGMFVWKFQNAKKYREKNYFIKIKILSGKEKI